MCTYMNFMYCINNFAPRTRRPTQHRSKCMFTAWLWAIIKMLKRSFHNRQAPHSTTWIYSLTVSERKGTKRINKNSLKRSTTFDEEQESLSFHTHCECTWFNCVKSLCGETLSTRIVGAQWWSISLQIEVHHHWASGTRKMESFWYTLARYPHNEEVLIVSCC